MAMKIEVGEKARRSDLFHLKPSAIVVDWAQNGRTDEVSDEKVKRLAEDIRLHGQLQPISVRRLSDKRVKIVSGYTRLRAGLLLEQEDDQFRLAAQVRDINDEEAFLENIRENLIRNETTPIDNAFNMRRLMQNYGKSKTEIAEFYGISGSMVGNYLKLLSLPDAVRAKVSNGQLKMTAALKLAKLSEDEIEDALKESEDDDGNVNGGKVDKAARKRGAKVGRTISDLRKVLKDRSDTVSLALIAFLDGKGEPTDLTTILDKDAPATSKKSSKNKEVFIEEDLDNEDFFNDEDFADEDFENIEDFDDILAN